MATNFPSSPSNGATHTFGGTVYTYNSTKGVWKAAAGEAVTISDTPPSNPGVGDLWFDSSVAKTYIYYNDGSSNQWVQMNPSGGSDGADGTDGADATGDGESPIIYTEPPTTHALNSDGTTSTVQMQAVDPEGTAITYGIAYANSTNALPDQLASATTIDQNTGTYTFTPTTTTSNAGNFKARLSASDGITNVKRFVDFSLSFLPVIEYLIVAGGGGGGGWAGGGGGGAGGVLTGTYTATSQNPGTFTVTVGDGGAGNSGQGAGTKGQNSSIFGLTAEGGGYGGYPNTGGSGGSGGGGGGNSPPSTGGAGTSGQGYDGGTTNNSGTGAGGGGAGGAGNDTNGSIPGDGGDGIQSSITGTATYYAGGGGGGRHNSTGSGGSAGLGGGGAGGNNSCASDGNGVAGTPNTGGGGGGAGGVGGVCGMAGGAGGSGVVILRTLETASATTGSPTVTTDGSYNIYTFTQTGSITF